MYLVRLYSEPQGLFESVEFRNGVNFIYGKKDVTDPKLSLNSIGKSTFLDLIDFCLLSSYQKSHNPRLVAAKEILNNYHVALEFRIGNDNYIIKRNVNNPNKEIIFGRIGATRNYELDALKEKLGSLIFNRPEYGGVFSPKWFRVLIGFFLKIQKFKQEKFQDPIKYIKELTDIEINIYHLYLLGLDNTLAVKNSGQRNDLKRIAPALEEVERLIEEKYNLKDLTQVDTNINKLRLDVKRFEKAVESFKLGEEYEDVEKNANKLTRTIKDLWFQNFSNRKKIEAYEASYSLPDKISTVRIKNIYEELNSSFAIEVKKSLDEAMKFRKQLSDSRKSFLLEEIQSLKKAIEEKEKTIHELEGERAKLFTFLSAKEAIKDLTEAFNIISEKRGQLSELEANTRTLKDLNSEKIQIELELKRTEKEVMQFVNSLSEAKLELFEQFNDIFNRIYVGSEDESSFDISFNRRKSKFIDISVFTPDMFGKGKNQGRTLVYDLMVLLNNITNYKNNFPRFLIHDGIFDGVDKAHFIAVYEFVQELAESGKAIQYITTINEEGTLSEHFGNADKVAPAKIENEAILVLSPNNKLFGKDFKASQ